jgi:uncharacterized protein with HEPN domain
VSFKHDAADCFADIIENIERIERHVLGLDEEAFDRDERTRDAVERCLERICETAHRLGDRARAIAPDQPWGDIRGMGNRLRHAYDDVELDTIWLTVTNRLPSLKASAQRALATLRP